MKHYCIIYATLLQLFFFHLAALSQQNKMQTAVKQEDDTVKILQTLTIEAEQNSAFKAEIRLDRSQILNQAKISFVNTLENLPGLSAIQMGVGIAKPVIRGMSFNRLVVSENGIKQQGQQWGSDHGLEIDAMGVDELRVTKGASALAYGSDAIGGAIEILPSKIDENPLQIENTSAYQSNNRLYLNSLGLKAKRGKLFVHSRVTWQQFGDYIVAARSFNYNGYVLPIFEGRLKNTAGQELNYKITAGWQSKQTQIRLMWSSFNQRAGIFGGAMGSPRFYSLKPDNSRNIELPRQVNSHNKLFLNILHFIGKSTLSLDVGWQQNQRREESVPHAHGRQQIDKNQTLALGMNLNVLTFNAKVERDLNTVSYAFGFANEIQQSQSSGFEFFIPNYRCVQNGFFALAEKKISPKFLTSGGIRFDRASFYSSQYLDDFYQEISGESFRSPEVNRVFTNFSAAWGLSANWSPRLKTKLNLSRSFRFPTVNELASNGIHHGTYRHEKGNPNLEPEVGYSFDSEISLKIKSFSLKFSPFAYYFPLYLYLSPAARFSPLPEAGQMYFHRQDRATLHGFEIEARYSIGSVLSASGHFALVRANSLTTILPLPFTPADKVYFRLDYEPEIKQLKLAFFADFAHYFAQNRTDRNERSTPSYSLLGAGLELHWKGSRMNLSVQNIANVPYLNHLSRYRILSIPEPGRNLRLSLTLPLVQKKLRF
jgi:iron complex outermembrane receptor protein